MCGIVGIVGDGEVAPLLVQSIARLEYRGYDSCGLAMLNSAGIDVRKDIGPVEEVALRQAFALAHGGVGIAHTRWARNDRLRLDTPCGVENPARPGPSGGAVGWLLR